MQVCCFPPFHLGLTVVAPLAEAVHVVLSDREYVLERSAVVLLVECSNLVPVLDLSVELLHLRETEASLRTYSFRISGHRRHLLPCGFNLPAKQPTSQASHQASGSWSAPGRAATPRSRCGGQSGRIAGSSRALCSREKRAIRIATAAQYRHPYPTLSVRAARWDLRRLVSLTSTA